MEPELNEDTVRELSLYSYRLLFNSNSHITNGSLPQSMLRISLNLRWHLDTDCLLGDQLHVQPDTVAEASGSAICNTAQQAAQWVISFAAYTSGESHVLSHMHPNSPPFFN